MVEDKLNNLKNSAKEKKVPIMFDEGLAFLLKEIQDNNIENILEVGSAVGYSAIKMATCKDNVKVTTIEKDEERFNEAKKNIKEFDLNEKITIINADALDVSLDEKYDLIFIDAAKSKNKAIFLHFKDNLKENGMIITDNLKFHGFVEKNPQEIKNRNTRQLVRKINEYITFLKENKEFTTTFYDLGDGVSKTIKKGND